MNKLNLHFAARCLQTHFPGFPIRSGMAGIACFLAEACFLPCCRVPSPDSGHSPARRQEPLPDGILSRRSAFRMNECRPMNEKPDKRTTPSPYRPSRLCRPNLAPADVEHPEDFGIELASPVRRISTRNRRCLPLPAGRSGSEAPAGNPTNMFIDGIN
jgi:hypothetical protein